MWAGCRGEAGSQRLQKVESSVQLNMMRGKELRAPQVSGFCDDVDQGKHLAVDGGWWGGRSEGQNRQNHDRLQTSHVGDVFRRNG